MSLAPQHVSKPHKRYVGLFHYCDYFRHWDEVVGVDGRWWVVREIGTTKVRKHVTQMDARLFADKPFQVTWKDLP